MGQGYIKPIFDRNHLHSLHGQFCGHHFLIPHLKALKVGTVSQPLGPKNNRLSVQFCTLLTGSTEKCEM